MKDLTIKSLFEIYSPKEEDLLISDALVFALCNRNSEINPVIERLALPYSSIINEMMIEYISKNTKLGLSNPQVDFRNLIGNNTIIFCKYDNCFIGCSFNCPVVAIAFSSDLDKTLPLHFYERAIVHEYTHKSTFSLENNALLTFISEGIAVQSEEEYMKNLYNYDSLENVIHYTYAYNFVKGVELNYTDNISYNRDIIRGNESYFIDKIRKIIKDKVPDIDVDAYLSLNGLLFYIYDYKHPQYCDFLYKLVNNFNKKLFDKYSVITQEEKTELKSSLAFTKIVNEFIEQMPYEIVGKFTRSLASFLCKSTLGNNPTTCLLLMDDYNETLEFLNIVRDRIQNYCDSHDELGVINEKTPIIREELNALKQKLGLQEDTITRGFSMY